MVAGPSVDAHHWVPKAEGGAETAWLHKICHRFVHETFSEKELARAYATPEALRAHPAVATFVAWVRRKPADYVDWPKSPRGRR